MYLALTYDHRLIDGREAVTFLRSIKGLDFTAVLVVSPSLLTSFVQQQLLKILADCCYNFERNSNEIL